MSASKNLGKVFMTPKGIWDKTLNYTKLDIVTNKVGKISCGYIATTDIEKNIEITDNRWLKLFELLDGDLTEEYKAVQTDVTNKATDVDTNKKAVDLIYSQMQKLYDVEISTTTPTNERTGLWINPDDISGVINIPEIKDDEVSDVDTWSSKKIDNVTNSLKEDLSNKITKFYTSNQGETNITDSDNGKIQDMMLYGKSSQDGTPTPDNPVEIKSVVNPTVKVSSEDGTKSQTVTLPYTLNAIYVESYGNVTIDGQQYVADYVDVERGKLVRMCKEVEYNGDESWELQSVNANNIANFKLSGVMALESKGLSNKLLLQNTLIANTDSEGFFINNIFQLYIRISKNRNISTVAEFKNFLSKNPIRVLLAFITPEEIDLTPEEIAAFKALATYYPVTNISVNSEQLDGYTVFNYPISMKNGWNYVKQQLNDNRDYIYDMDTQSAEAYVNSEYAVALTELEV